MVLWYAHKCQAIRHGAKRGWVVRYLLCTCALHSYSASPWETIIKNDQRNALVKITVSGPFKKSGNRLAEKVAFQVECGQFDRKCAAQGDGLALCMPRVYCVHHNLFLTI